MKRRRILLSVTALSFAFQVAAQDLIYKKNGEIIKVKILNSSGNSYSYHLLEQADSIVYFINNALIDSITSQNGEKENLNLKIAEFKFPESPVTPVYNHHLVGLDLAGYLLYRNLILSYEYLPGYAKLGFKAAFAANLKSHEYYEYGDLDFTRSLKWSTRIGMNYYLFPPRTFRFGTGLYYFFGHSQSDYYNFISLQNPIPNSENVHGMVLGIFGFYNLTKYLAANFGWDIPLFVNPSFYSKNAVIRCEVLINF